MTAYTPPPEAVEAAAAAIERDLRTRTAPPDRISGQGGLGLTCEQIATAALTAAGPLIAAEALREGVRWLRSALAEVTTPSSTPTEPTSLAGEYWRGYRAARDEMLDLLDEPALLERLARGEGS